MGLWSGLGYYSRARNLHRCAHAPSWSTALGRRVSRDAAGAWSHCPASGARPRQRSPRCVSASGWRFWMPMSPGAGACAGFRRTIWLQLGQPERNCGQAPRNCCPHRPAQTMPRYTQGMMDLGATVCLPRAPACGSLPGAERAAGLRMGYTRSAFPGEDAQTQAQRAVGLVVVARAADGSVWLQRRPHHPGVWAGSTACPWFDSREALEAGAKAYRLSGRYRIFRPSSMC
jgi:A/G-specific adenine glycosylase